VINDKTKNEKLMLAFGEHIRKLRKEKGMSMEELADAAEVEYSQIAKIERGKINTSISTAFRLSTALEVPLEQLFQFQIPS